MSDPDNYHQSDAHVMERHAQSVLVIVIVALMIWVGTTTQATSVQIATLQVEVTQLKDTIAAPNQTIDLLIQQNEELRARVLKLEDSGRRSNQ